MSNSSISKRVLNITWLSRWAGAYTFTACSFWGPQYHRSLKKVLGVNFDHTLFLHRKGTVAFYVADQEFQKFGSTLAKKATKDKNFAKKLCAELKNSTDVLMPRLSKLQTKIPTWQEYQKFLPVFERHLAYHNFVKKTVDFFDLKTLDRLLPYFKDARIYSEAVYSESERFFRNIAKQIAKKEKYSADILTCLTQAEFERYLKKRTLPPKKILSDRFQSSALYFERGKENVIVGRGVGRLNVGIAKQGRQSKNQLFGIGAYPGNVRGTARIILNPHQPHIFNQNDILVTGMTRPEFMPYIKKASAIVTDVGGMLCHAAITARELHVPCVVGTRIATQIFNNGDRLEVNAGTGVITLIKH